MKKYPKVLVVTIGRINESDTFNNGLFLRSLFGDEWPRDNLAQIYSSGDNGDQGFFSRYYQIGANDRLLGNLFYRVKKDINTAESFNVIDRNHNLTIFSKFKRQVSKFIYSLFIDTGLYEVLFPPRISKEMLEWVVDFKPDIILAQGYNLTFCRLPLLLKTKTNAKLAVLTTDDWPKYLYSGLLGEPIYFKWFIRPLVTRTAKVFFGKADIPFAFGFPMAQEYESRYGKFFNVINHSDNKSRFDSSLPIKLNDGTFLTIVAIGVFNQYRLPLLLDVNLACEQLEKKGINIRLSVFSSFIEDSDKKLLSNCSYVDIYSDPGHELLPAYLKGADVLLLAEGFEPKFVEAIELSISTKAHIFMFSSRPIIVYAGERTGVSSYAKNYQWASVVSTRSVDALADAIWNIVSDSKLSQSLIERANTIANQFHTKRSNQSTFIRAMLGDSIL